MTTASNTITRLATAILLLGTIPLAAQQPAPKKSARAAAPAAAKRAALAWLDLLDHHDFQAAFDSAAPNFRIATSVAVFAREMEKARGPYEPFGRHAVQTTNVMHDPPTAAPGDYVIFKFYSTVKDGTVTELVTTERKEDGKWRVDGYFLEPGKR